MEIMGQGERRQYFNPVLGRALIDPGGSHWFVTLEQPGGNRHECRSLLRFALRLSKNGSKKDA